MTGELLGKSYRTSESGLSEAQVPMLAFPAEGLVPCELNLSGETFTLTFDTWGLLPYTSVLRLSKSERYRCLGEAAGLERLRAAYSFSLAPDNLFVDPNLIPSVLERDIRPSPVAFLDQYRSLIISTMLPRVSYTDALRGQKQLNIRDSFLSRVLAMNTAQEMSGALLDKARSDREEKEKKEIPLGRRRALTRQLAASLLILAFLASAALTVKTALIDYPVKKAVVTAAKIWEMTPEGTGITYTGIIAALEDVEPKDMPLETRYILARSYVYDVIRNDEELRLSMLESVRSHRGNEDYLDFWIYLGRGRYEEALSCANDDEQLHSILSRFSGGSA